MDVEWAAVFAVLKTGAVLIGFPLGVAVGYAWRAHISHVRRVRRERGLPRWHVIALWIVFLN